MVEERTSTTTLWGGSGNAPHLALIQCGPTRKSLQEGVLENDVPTYTIRVRRLRSRENGEPSEDHDHSTVL